MIGIKFGSLTPTDKNRRVIIAFDPGTSMMKPDALIESLPELEHDISQYLYVDGEWIYDECDLSEYYWEEQNDEPTTEDRIEAQVMYTALMTDTLLTEE